MPLERGCDGAYIETWRFLPHIEANAQDTFSAALYQMSGVRAIAHGRVGRDDYVPVQIPRLAMTNEQLDQVADAIIHLHAQAEKIQALQVTAEGLVSEFREKPVAEKLDDLVAPDSVLARFGAKDSDQPFLASMGIYLFRREILIDILQGRGVAGSLAPEPPSPPRGAWPSGRLQARRGHHPVIACCRALRHRAGLYR